MNINFNFSLDIAKSLVSSTEQFPVDFDNAWQWLEFSRKDVAKKSFEKCGFAESLDFSQLRQKVELVQGGNTYKEEIKLTVECFKTWAMMVNTEKGKQVRKYFLECEKIAKDKTTTPSDSVSMLTLIQNSLKVVEGLIIKQEQLELKLALEAQRTDKLEEVVAQHDAELDRIFKPHGDYYTAMGYGNLLGMKLSLKEASNIGKKASAKCRELGITIEQTRDPRFGTVGLYPETILKECF
jgi:phage anti-repressor protein